MCSQAFAPLKTLEKRTPANNYEQPALNWGTRGRGFKSRQPDWDRAGVHTLRHYVATRLLSNGVEMMVVSRILGHESIKTTVDIYGHLQDNQRRQALSSLA